jgi:hypothetical protein
MNNPINASDPTGHKCVGEPDECLQDDGSSGRGFTGGTHSSGFHGGCGNPGQRRCDGKPANSEPPLIGPQEDPEDPYVTTINIGGVNSASQPGVYDSEGGTTITTAKGALAFGFPTTLNIAAPIVNQSSKTTDTSIWLSYLTMPNGSVDNMMVSVDNRNGDSNVYLNSVLIKTTSFIHATPPATLLQSSPYLATRGQVKNTAICNNCLAENVLQYDFPIDRYSQITISVNITAYYSLGGPGTVLDTIPVSYTIPIR